MSLGYATAIADLYARQGAAQARGVIGRANAWIPAVQAIPASLGQWAEARDARKVQAQQAELRGLQLREAQRGEQQQLRADSDKAQIRSLGAMFTDDPEGMAREVNVINPEMAAPYQAAALARQAQVKDQMYRAVGSVLELPPEKQQEGWTHHLDAFVQSKIIPHADQLPKEWSPAWGQDMLRNTASTAQLAELMKPKPAEDVVPVNVDGKAIYTPKSKAIGQEQFRVPVALKAPDDKEQGYRDFARDVLKKPYETMTFAEKRRADTAIAAATRVPEKVEKPKRTDDPELPRPIQDYLYSLTRKTDPANNSTYTMERAEDEVARQWPRLRAAHPDLNPIKVKEALTKLFGKGGININVGAVVADALKEP